MQPVLVGAVTRSLRLAAGLCRGPLSKHQATEGRLPRFTLQRLVTSGQVSGRRRWDWAGSFPSWADFPATSSLLALVGASAPRALSTWVTKAGPSLWKGSARASLSGRCLDSEEPVHFLRAFANFSHFFLPAPREKSVLLREGNRAVDHGCNGQFEQ